MVSIFSHYVNVIPLCTTVPFLVDRLPVIANVLLFNPSVVKLCVTVWVCGLSVGVAVGWNYQAIGCGAAIRHIGISTGH